LLFSKERRQISGLQERLEDPVLRAQDVGRVLPRAVTVASAKDNQLLLALTPTVEQALKESVKRDPSALVNAIFPVIGPAIRKSIAETFNKLVQSLNQALDHSFSARGVKWRLEAARTGRSFAEVVLAHTLVYRVEQVFLIHKRTGLLLLHVLAPNIKAQDAALVSSMLTAIQDFVQDSFRVSPGEALHTLQVGELTIWVESSPLATLAAVIRGHAPYDFRTVLQKSLEEIHGEHLEALNRFDGDASMFELARPRIECCLQAEFARPTSKPFPLKLVILAVTLLLLVGVGCGFLIHEKRRWSSYVERLKNEPGIVVTESGQRWGQYFVAGLRDPLAADPTQFLGEFKIKPDQVTGRWEAYQALHPQLLLKRATAILQPPSEVTLRLRDGTLFAEGFAPAGWAESVRQRAGFLPGVHAFDTSGLQDDALVVLAERQRAVENTLLFFGEGTQLISGQESTLDALVTHLGELQQAAARAGRRVRVSVIGHTDSLGSEEHNLRLSLLRADHVINLLASRGFAVPFLTAAGVADRAPLRTDFSDEEKVRNRRVSFRVTLEPTANSREP
jgi:OOP family OmpA-OmpF porin